MRVNDTLMRTCAYLSRTRNSKDCAVLCHSLHPSTHGMTNVGFLFGPVKDMLLGRLAVILVFWSNKVGKSKATEQTLEGILQLQHEKSR